MTNTAPLIVWFRNDLRLTDNPALSHAAKSGQPVIALYILDETPGVRQLWRGIALVARQVSGEPRLDLRTKSLADG